jgi:hypothetical protein
MPDDILLLGRTLSVTVEPGAEDLVGTVYPVIRAAADVLNSQNDQGKLNATAVDYIGALRGLGIAQHRSFTPCIGTADIGDGEFIFFVGAEDVAQNADPNWYASTIIHDGGHAWLSQQDKPSTGVPVEVDLTQIQIDYYTTVDGPPSYIADLQAYRDDPAAIQARIMEEV